MKLYSRLPGTWCVLIISFVTLCSLLRAQADSIPDRVREGIRLEESGRYQEARSIFVEAFQEAQVQQLPLLDIAAIQDNLAAVESDLGHYAAAETILQRTLGALQKAGELDSHGGATIVSHLATLYIEGHNVGQAIPLLRRYRQIFERKPEEDPAVVAEDLANLGRMYMALNNPKDALPCFVGAADALSKTPYTEDLRVVPLMTAQAAALAMLNRNPEAITQIERAVAMIQNIQDVSARTQLDVWATRGLIYSKEKQSVEVDLSFQKAAEAVKTGYGDAHPLFALVLKANAQALQNLGKKREAKILDERSNAILAQNGLPTRQTVDFGMLIPPDPLDRRRR